jgi:glutamine amidotransferase
MVEVAVVDYGVGNLRSIRRGLELAGASVVVTGDADKIEAADAIVLPGVGAFGSAMRQLGGKLEVIRGAVASEKPLLGVCLGMQLLFDSSEESDISGMGLIKGKVLRLPRGLKVPQMGWNSIELKREHPFVEGIPSGSDVYFLHSYHTCPDDPKLIVASTEYEIEFPAIIASDHIVGTQFHPEKSGKVGLMMLKNFVGMIG